MLTYEKLRRKPSLFREVVGLTVQEFNPLCLRLEPAYRQSEKTRLSRPGLSETQFKHALRSRLLMTLIRIEHSLTYKALGELFELHESNVSRNVRRMLALLQERQVITKPPVRKGSRRLEELMSKFPGLREVMEESVEVKEYALSLALSTVEGKAEGKVVVEREAAPAPIPVADFRASTIESYDYDEILPTIQDYFLGEGAAIPSWDVTPQEKQQFKYAVLKALIVLGIEVGEDDLQAVAGETSARMLGLGVLQPYIEMDGVEEIVVRNGYVRIYRYGRFLDVGDLSSDGYFKALAHKVSDFGGKELTAGNPMCVVDIPGGARFAVVIPPLSIEGTAINIRRFGVRKLTLEDMAAGPIINPETGERTSPAFDEETSKFLKKAAREMHMSVVFSGRPGSGKTTLLNAFSAHMPKDAQVCVVEGFRELELACPHLVKCVVTEAMEESKATRAAVVNALYTRMRPDVLVVGEVVGAEAREYLQAINLGVVAHTTMHGNSCLDALYRLETLALEPHVPLLATQERIARGVNLVVHLDISRGKRYIQEMALVEGLRDGRYELDVIKRRNGDGNYTPLPKNLLQ